jgi:hypothetical protein
MVRQQELLKEDAVHFMVDGKQKKREGTVTRYKPHSQAPSDQLLLARPHFPGFYHLLNK